MCSVANGWSTRVFATTNGEDGLVHIGLERVSFELLIAIFIHQFRFVRLTGSVTPGLLFGIATSAPNIFLTYFHHSLQIVRSIDGDVRNTLS